MDQPQTGQAEADTAQKPHRPGQWKPGQSGNPSGNQAPKAFAKLYAALLADFDGVQLSASDRALLGSAARLLARRMKSDLIAVKAAATARRIIDDVFERHRQRRRYTRKDEATPSGWSPLRSSLSEVTDDAHNAQRPVDEVTE